MQETLALLKQHAARCLGEFRQNRLTESSLQQLADLIEAAPRTRQNLLYIQGSSTHPGSTALGMLLIVDGECTEPPPDPKEWPYRSALDAVKDGWRIIAFPNLALLADPAVPQGLGCDFILEKWV
jgi:hypothetical protein